MMQLTSLPDPALEVFINTVAEAVELGDSGQPERGYSRLLGAQQRIQQACARGEEWAEGLSQQYCLAMARYANRYGVPPR